MKLLPKPVVGILCITFSTMIGINVSAQANPGIAPVHTLPMEVEEPSQGVEKLAGLRAFIASQPGTDVNVSGLTGNEAEVSIDVNPVDPLNQVIVGHAPGFGTMNTFYTMDGGATWTRVELGDADDGLTSTFRFDPTVAFDDTGNVYAAYGARTAVPAPGTGNQRTVVVCRSTDGGQTYPQCTQISTTADVGTTPGNDKWHLATGPDPDNPAQQNVYIAWTQNITEAAGTDQRIVVSVSTDGGATFSAPLIINDASIAGTSSGNLFADPAVGPNGELYVAWHSIGTNQILMDVSTDGGANFGTDIAVTSESVGFKTSIPPQPDRGIFAGPTIDTDRSGGAFDGRLYLAYVDTTGLPDTDIFVRSSADGGTTWSAPILVNDDGGSNSQFLPWLDVDQLTGVVSVVWYDARNDTNNQQVEVFSSLSDDGGATFGPNTIISDNPSDQSTANASRWGNNFLEYIGIASFDCQAFAVWADNSTDPADLDFFTDQVQINGLDTPVCNQPPLCDANGPYTAECGEETALDGSASTDPEGDPLTYEWTGDFTPSPASGEQPKVVFVSPTGPKTVTLKVDDGVSEPQECEAPASVQDTLPPTISAPADITEECESPAGTSVDLGTPTVADKCDSDVDVTNDAPPSFPLGPTTVTWTATDDDSNSATDTQTVTIEDTIPPVISCNSPPTIVPPDAPISFSATAEDQCEGPVDAEVVAFDCFTFTKKGKRIDKTESCVVSFEGDTVTISDSGGVGDNIEWTVAANDDSGNTTTEVCSLVVVNPGKGN